MVLAVEQVRLETVVRLAGQRVARVAARQQELAAMEPEPVGRQAQTTAVAVVRAHRLLQAARKAGSSFLGLKEVGMQYIHVASSRYPLKVEDIRRENPNFSCPQVPPVDAISLLGYAPVAEVAKPAFNATTHEVLEAPPAQVGGIWTQQWSIVALSAEAARKAVLDAGIAGDATIASLKAMTNAEISAWFTANITTLAQARTLLERLTRIIIRKVL